MRLKWAPSLTVIPEYIIKAACWLETALCGVFITTQTFKGRTGCLHITQVLELSISHNWNTSFSLLPAQLCRLSLQLLYFHATWNAYFYKSIFSKLLQIYMLLEWCSQGRRWLRRWSWSVSSNHFSLVKCNDQPGLSRLLAFRPSVLC